VVMVPEGGLEPPT